MTKGYSKLSTMGAALIAALLLVGCGTVPVYNINDAPVQVDAENYTAKDVKKAIIKAGMGLGWRIKEREPGKLVGKLNVRRHMATVEILYSKSGYSINYTESAGLKYNPESDEIHKSYNKWIRNLDQRIQMNLFSL